MSDAVNEAKVIRFTARRWFLPDDLSSEEIINRICAHLGEYAFQSAGLQVRVARKTGSKLWSIRIDGPFSQAPLIVKDIDLVSGLRQAWALLVKTLDN